MGKHCFQCKKKFGFREDKWTKENVLWWCNELTTFDSLVPETCTNQLTCIMGEKDWVCGLCFQKHTLEHHLMAQVDYERRNRKEKKFKQWIEENPLALSELAPTWDLNVKGDESWSTLYDKIKEQNNNTEETCPWCKKIFTFSQMTGIGFTYQTKTLECTGCSNIRSGLSSEKLRDLQRRLARAESKSNRIASSLASASSAKSSAETRSFIDELGSAYHLKLNNPHIEHYASEANARYLGYQDEQKDIIYEITDLESQIFEEKTFLAEKHFFGNKEEHVQIKPTTEIPKVSNQDDDILRILKTRFAKGEINKQEFDEMQSTLLKNDKSIPVNSSKENNSDNKFTSLGSTANPSLPENKMDSTSAGLFCINCGHSMKPEGKFCGKCGTAVQT
jgi:hypothetical protein